MAHTNLPQAAQGIPLSEVPKVELHLHFEGCMSPALIQKLARKYNLTLDLAFSEDGKRILWKNFIDFLFKYDEASRVACTIEAVEEIAYEYLRSSHKNGSIYNELTVSPDHLERFGLSYTDAITAVEKGMQRAKHDFDIDSNIIIVILRHGNKPDFADLETSRKRSQEEATRLLDIVLSHSFKHVVAIGLAGAEIQFPPELFVEHFKRAAAAGLGLTAHAGEWTNAEDVMKAINLLGVTRVGHGIHLAFDKEKLLEAKNRCIHFEICPHSNLSLNTKQNYPDQAIAHPVNIFHEHDMSYSLASDDPPFFGTNLQKEYQYMLDHLDMSTKDLLHITLNGIEASFASPELKVELRQKLKTFAEKYQISFDLEETVNVNRSRLTN